ncbi:42913_t:CDS:2 [Gigaspora margarita]|uniref:42913_t:CDS:1 n=1 Tax=Gigaspora margarita TaxID=4874 RepID=A0ABN7V4C5_GIGMA|nr:42913_t:CDS:2 [Gigaspora margarita]
MPTCSNGTYEDERINRILQENNIYVIDPTTIQNEKPVKAFGIGIIEKGILNRRIVMKRLSEESVKKLEKQELLRNLQNFEAKSHLLVLEDAEYGNLHDFVIKNKDLSWAIKIRILKDVAYADNIREKPVIDTPITYLDLYQKCWDFDSKKRPTIDEVCEQLEIILQEEPFNVDDLTFEAINAQNDLQISNIDEVTEITATVQEKPLDQNVSEKPSRTKKFKNFFICNAEK